VESQVTQVLYILFTCFCQTQVPFQLDYFLYFTFI